MSKRTVKEWQNPRPKLLDVKQAKRQIAHTDRENLILRKALQQVLLKAVKGTALSAKIVHTQNSLLAVVDEYLEKEE